jgi:hypothetical protein
MSPGLQSFDKKNDTFEKHCISHKARKRPVSITYFLFNGFYRGIYKRKEIPRGLFPCQFSGI